MTNNEMAVLTEGLESGEYAKMVRLMMDDNNDLHEFARIVKSFKSGRMLETTAIIKLIAILRRKYNDMALGLNCYLSEGYGIEKSDVDGQLYYKSPAEDDLVPLLADVRVQQRTSELKEARLRLKKIRKDLKDAQDITSQQSDQIDELNSKLKDEQKKHEQELKLALKTERKKHKDEISRMDQEYSKKLEKQAEEMKGREKKKQQVQNDFDKFRKKSHATEKQLKQRMTKLQSDHDKAFQQLEEEYSILNETQINLQRRHEKLRAELNKCKGIGIALNSSSKSHSKISGSTTDLLSTRMKHKRARTAHSQGEIGRMHAGESCAGGDVSELSKCSAEQAAFDENMKQLETYKAMHGDVNVTFDKDPSLFRWCCSLRTSFRSMQKGKKSNGILTEERIDALRQIGFVCTLNGSSSQTSSTTADAPPHIPTHILMKKKKKYQKEDYGEPITAGESHLNETEDSEPRRSNKRRLDEDMEHEDAQSEINIRHQQSLSYVYDFETLDFVPNHDQHGAKQKDVEDERGNENESERESSPTVQNDIEVLDEKERSKALFEEERAKVLEQIPDECKKEFRTLGFVKWSKHYLPVMVLGPYDVPPGPLRDQWMKNFDKFLKNGRQMAKLVYWYGASYDLRNGYSYITKNNFIPLEEGKKKGFDQVPMKILRKRITEVKMTKIEQLLYDGLKEQLRDSKKPPEQRSPWLFKFKEDHDDHTDSTDDESGEYDTDDVEMDKEGEEEKSSSTPNHVDEGMEILPSASSSSSLCRVEEAEEVYLSSFMV